MQGKRKIYRASEGTIYLRGHIHHCRFSIAGQEVRGTTGCSNATDAQRFLNQKKLEWEERLNSVNSMFEEVFYEDVMEAVANSYVVNNYVSIKKVGQADKHLGKSFKGKKVSETTAEDFRHYDKKRLSENAAPATINR